MDISSDEYVRKRISPKYGDDIYIILTDLLAAIQQLAPLKSKRILDFGAGGSPYESLFSGVYEKADVTAYPGVTLEIDSKGHLPKHTCGYDLVISSQVLEHVTNPQTYLSECFRVLEPGGQLLLTTHGTYEDHPCPEDYWRWTSDGLEKELAAAGFTIEKSLKTTCGVRAVLFLWQQQTHRIRLKPPYGVGPKNWIIYLALKVLRRLAGAPLQRFADWWVGDEDVKNAADPSATLYVSVAILARKPLRES